MAILFKTIDDLKKYISVTKSYDIEEFGTKVDFAVNKYLKKWLGKTQLDAIIAAYDASPGTPLTTQQQLLVDKIQPSLAHFVFYEHIPYAQIVIDDSGITRKENENYKTAYANQITKLSQSAITSGYDTLEMLLGFMEDNEADYPLWTNDDAYTKNKEFFINSSVDFAEQYPITRGRQTFKSLFPIMRDVESFYITQCLGQLFYDELKAKILNKTPFTSKETILIGFIKKAISFLSISRGVKNGWVKYNSSGVISSGHTDESNFITEETATNEQASLKVRETETTGEMYLTRVKDYLKANSSDFPTWENDPEVNPPADETDCGLSSSGGNQLWF